jgi:hypothetical protein
LIVRGVQKFGYVDGPHKVPTGIYSNTCKSSVFLSLEQLTELGQRRYFQLCPRGGTATCDILPLL